MSKVLFENYDLSNLNIVGVCDKSFENKKGETFYNYPCIAPEDLRNTDFDSVCVMILRYAEIVKSLRFHNPDKSIQALLN